MPARLLPAAMNMAAVNLEGVRAALRPPLRTVLIVLALSLTASVLVWGYAHSLVREAGREQFVGITRSFVGEVGRTMTAYEQLLRGGAALFHTTGQFVTRKKFQLYIQSLDTQSRFPGLQGIGFAQVLAPGEVRSHIAQVRRDGHPGYRVWPEGERETYTAIRYIEPFDEMNRRALGFDMYSEPKRRAAMDRARDTGEPSASESVTLVQEQGADVQAGFLLYLPVYNDDKDTGTVELRRAALQGFVYSPFRIGDLMRNIRARSFDSVRDLVGIEIVDVTDPNAARTVYSSERDAADSAHRPAFTSESTVEYYGARWTYRFSSTRSFEASLNDAPALATLIAALFATALVTALSWSQAMRQLQSTEANERMSLMTRELAHRVKNTLAVVQSIASRSMSEGRSVAEARGIFMKRLHALARAHTLLLDNAWSGASLAALVQGELAPFGRRAVIGGPDIALSANVTQMFALILHELATNAVKYGAFSTPHGLVKVTWARSGPPGARELTFEWKERGGPPVVPPTRRGFGQTLLRQSLAHGTRVEPTIAFEPDGLRYAFTVPLAQITLATEDEPETQAIRLGEPEANGSTSASTGNGATAGAKGDQPSAPASADGAAPSTSRSA
ncbi:MAG: CHASE domain-containing protein [Hyphomicrobiaceae bacterium]|nr:CHASE domain-containing protein [Hyphomicrobiaceae bacterium]